MGIEQKHQDVSRVANLATEVRNSPEYKAKQAALQVLWEMSTSQNTNSFPVGTKELARKISDVIDSDDLIIEGSVYGERFAIGRFDTVCYEGGVLFVGSDFEEALSIRPDSARAELLYVASKAALASGKRSISEIIGGMQSVEDVIVDFLSSLPADTPITSEQAKLIEERGINQ